MDPRVVHMAMGCMTASRSPPHTVPLNQIRSDEHSLRSKDIGNNLKAYVCATSILISDYYFVARTIYSDLVTYPFDNTEIGFNLYRHC
jgi:hypothetical protein